MIPAFRTASAHSASACFSRCGGCWRNGLLSYLSQHSRSASNLQNYLHLLLCESGYCPFLPKRRDQKPGGESGDGRSSRMKSKSATGYFSNDVIDDIGIRHDLVSVFRFVEALACLRTVENQHCAFGGNLKFLRKLHYYARDFPVKYIIFHKTSELTNSRYLSIISWFKMHT